MNTRLNRLFIASVLAAAAPLGAEVVQVTTTASDGPGSLKAAIEIANADPTATDIQFAIPTGGTDVPAILPLQLSVPLPPITTLVTIDGATQPVSRILIRNLTPFPTFELTTGSGGSRLKSMDIRGQAVELKAPKLTVEDCDFADVSGVGVWLGNEDNQGEAVDNLMLRNNRFTNADLYADLVPSFITVQGNTFTRSRVATLGLGGQAMLDSTFQNNTFDCVDLPSPTTAITIKHPIRNAFRANVFKNCPGGIYLWSQTGSSSVGHNLVEGNIFQGGEMSIGISGRRHAHNKITRNLSTGNTNEPIKLNGLTMATYGSDDKPNHGKGRPAITSAFLIGPFLDRKVSLSGTTFVTTATDTVEIFVTDGAYTYTPASDYLVLSPKRYLTSVTATNGVWSAVLDLSTFGLTPGPTSFSVTATDADDNTSEFAVPVSLWVAGF